MFVSALALGLVGLAAASPIASRQVMPNYPVKTSSKGFTLSLNVTDLSRDLTPSVNNYFITGVHVGAGLNVASAAPTGARVFYANGTVEEWRYGRSNILSEGGSGTSVFPQGLQLSPVAGSDVLSQASINGGAGTAGIFISRFPEPYSFLGPETWAACKESAPYLGGATIITLKQADWTVDEDGSINDNVPEGCAPIRLVPECAELQPLEPGTIASREFALDTQCYDDVSALDWTLYGP